MKIFHLNDLSVNCYSEVLENLFFCVVSIFMLAPLQILRRFKDSYFEIAALILKMYKIHFNLRCIVPIDYTYICVHVTANVLIRINQPVNECAY